MRKIQKCGRKKDETRNRYPGEQPKPIDNDFGPLDQRLKRQVAIGVRSLDEAASLTLIFDKLDRAGIAQTSINRFKVQKDLLKAGVLSQKGVLQAVAFNRGSPFRRGISSLDILLARNIITNDHFDSARDFTTCWEAYIGRPWPKGSSAERQSKDHNGGFSEAALKRFTVRYWNYLAALKDKSPIAFTLVRDICLFERTGGLMNSVLSLNIRRIDNTLIADRPSGVPPDIRQRIAHLTGGLETIMDIQSKDYTPQARTLLDKLKEGASQALAFASTGDICYDVTLSAACSFTFTPPASAGPLRKLTLIIRPAGFQASLPGSSASVVWAGGSVPPISQTAINFISFASDGTAPILGGI